MTIQADSGASAPSTSAAPAAGSTAPASAPSVPADGSPAGSGSDLESIFRFDPFSSETAPAPSPTPEPTPAPQATPATPAPSAATPAAAAPQGQPTGNLQDPAIIGKLDEIARAVKPQPQPGQQVDPVEQVNLPNYGVEVPAPLMALIGSENPAERQQGVQHLVRGVAEMTHRNVVVAMRRELQAVLPQIIHQQVTMITETKRIHEDFYGTHKHLNNPALYGVVMQVGAQTARELGINNWSPELRDKIAERVTALLGGVLPQPQAPRPPAFTPSGARPQPNVPPNGSQEKFLADLF